MSCNAAYQQKYREKHRSRTAVYWKIYASKNKERLRDYRRKYRLGHLAEIRSAQKQWTDNNRERRLFLQRRWRKSNPDKQRAIFRRYYSKRYKHDIGFRLRCCLANRLSCCLRIRSISKDSNKTTMRLLGCSIGSFEIYLESKFEPGMTWDNYGKGKDKWNIDHIIPCSLFDLTKEKHRLSCFHFSNLQPMWEPENQRKSNQILLEKSC